MKLQELMTAADIRTSLAPHQAAQEMRDIACDSRRVKPGSLFVAVRGFHSDGHHFISQAVRNGASAIIAENGGAVEGAGEVPVIRVPDSRAALAHIAAAFFGNPSRDLSVIGITGTKGKTTTSYLVKSIIEATGRTTGLIGTIDYRVADTIYPAPNTTPESMDIQRLMREMLDAGCKYCVMEVSSHALALGRIDGCEFDIAVFTNLKQDHLDFHKNMESYFQAKLQLFKRLEPHKTSVVNNDEPVSQDIIMTTEARTFTFGMSASADIHPMEPTEGIGRSINGLSFSVHTPRGMVNVKSPLVGKHNVYNILAAIGAGIALGIGTDGISRGIETMKAVPGRMEKVDEGQPFGVVVDYAHTEDSLANLLVAVRDMTKGRVITLFGCGGDRDRTKRPRMGAAALRESDIVIITTDNPRSEDPLDIIREIATGMHDQGFEVAPQDAGAATPAGNKPYYIIPDRREAIAAAMRMAWPGDMVVLAGKGHETYQVIGERKIHFDDREAAREEIRKQRGA